MDLFGLPQPLSGQEIFTIWQLQNGQWAKCTMPISELSTVITFNFAAWAAGLPTTRPSTAGLPWNDGGVISIS
jgi:hypothetical protein